MFTSSTTNGSISAAPALGVEVAPRSKDLTRRYAGELDFPDDRVLAENGYRLEIYEKLLEDHQVLAGYEQRQNALIAHPWEVEAGGSSDIDDVAADWLKEVLNHIAWDDVNKKIQYAVHYGYAVSELLLEKDGDLVYPDKIKVRKQRRFRFDKDGRLRLITWESWEGEDVETLYPGKWWYFRTGGDNDDDPYGRGLASVIYWCVWFKKNGGKFWAVYLEKFGQPTPIGKHSKAATDAEKQVLLQAVRACHTDSAIVIPEGMMIELLEATRSGAGDYQAFLGYWDRAIAKLILGQTMTLEGAGGVDKGEMLHQVRTDIIQSDSDLICHSANRGWIRNLSLINYPSAAPPRVWRKITDRPDLNAQAIRDTEILSWGYRPKAEYVKTTYGDGFTDIQAPAIAADGSPIVDQPAPLYQGLGQIGTQSLLNFLTDNTLPRDNAIQVLINVFGLPEETAIAITPDRPAPEIAPATAQFSAPSNTIDKFTERLRQKAEPQFERMLEEVRSRLDSAGSLREFRDSLDQAFPDLDGDALTEIMAEAMFSSRLAGIFEAQEDAE